MSTLNIELNWSRDFKGYRLRDYGKYGLTIINNGGDLIPTKPFERNEMVFNAFAKVASPDAL